MKIEIEDLRKVQGIGSKTIDRIYELFQEKEDTEIENINLDDIPSFTTGDVTIYNGEAIQVMGGLAGKGIMFDAIITDPPYNSIACKWDVIIPFISMWERLNKLIKFNGVIALFGSEPFSSNLRTSNIKNYKYDWKWKKTKAIGFQHSKNRPMKIMEDILVFSNGSMGHISQLGDRRMVYNPQGITPLKEKVVSSTWHGDMMGARPNQVGKKYLAYTGFPNELLEYKQPIGQQSIHPTQKPVELVEYLIKTYTQEGETVLDFTFGSGTTAIACINTNRKFVGIELDEGYFNIAKERIQKRLGELETELQT